MRVIVAEVSGMCFGVRDALKRIAEVEAPGRVTIHGELVHNEVVLDRLDARGFARVGEEERGGVPATPEVLITAHGISDAERRRLEGAGKRLIDTTCPLVTRVHRAARALAAEGYHILVVGRPGHVEVRGIVEDLERCDVLASPADVRTYSSARLGVVCQTTATEANVREIRDAISERNPTAEVRFVDTVCHPTKDHQRALEGLLDRVDAVVVVGGRNSNNTRALAERSRARGIPALHVQGPADLDPGFFAGCETVGLTAGTSTLDETIEAVRRALVAMSGGDAAAEGLLRSPLPLHSEAMAILPQ